jgi:thioredoxin-related protein
MRWLVVVFLFFNLRTEANDSTKLYNPYANVDKDVKAAIAKAKKEKKQVMLQIGGNWCVWCYRFNSFVQLDSSLKKLLNDNYVVYHLNHSKENKNLGYLKKLGFPQRFGLPVIVILDADGNRIHTQDTSLLEKGNGYDAAKVKSFFKEWSRGAFEEVLYNE